MGKLTCSMDTNAFQINPNMLLNFSVHALLRGCRKFGQHASIGCVGTRTSSRARKKHEGRRAIAGGMSHATATRLLCFDGGPTRATWGEQSRGTQLAQ